MIWISRISRRRRRNAGVGFVTRRPFRRRRGFRRDAGVDGNPGVVSLRLLEVAIRPVARCAGCLEETFLRSLEEAAGTALAYLEALAEDGGDRLVGGGGDARDRNYARLRRARGARELLVACVGAGEAERRVSGRASARWWRVCSGCPRSTCSRRAPARSTPCGTGRAVKPRGWTFATRRSSRRRRVVSQPRWFSAHVPLLVYLHHKQYVDQVVAICGGCDQEGAARAEYLDILWDVTRKPDTFEEVKHNVYDLLAALAWHFSEEQLDDLFRRVERAGKIALSDDAGKILEMVQKLARSDARGIMAERLLELLWRMTHSGEGGRRATRRRSPPSPTSSGTTSRRKPASRVSRGVERRRPPAPAPATKRSPCPACSDPSPPQTRARSSRPRRRGRARRGGVWFERNEKGTRSPSRR